MTTPSAASAAYKDEIRVIASTAAHVYAPSGGGAVASRTVAGKLNEWPSCFDFGAAGDGVTDDSTAFSNLEAKMADSHIGYVPGPNVYYDGTYTFKGPFLWINKGYTGAVSLGVQARSNAVLITTETAATSPYSAAESRVALNITAFAKGAQHASGGRFNLYNDSTYSGGCVAIYTHAESNTTTAWTAALHGETRGAGGTNMCINAEAASYTASGSMYGAVLSNVSASGTIPNPLPLSGTSPTDHPSSTALLINGHSDVDQMGGWKYGINFAQFGFKDGSGPNGRSSCIRFEATGCEHLLHSTSSVACNTADILLEGNSNNGIVLNGTYTNAAIRISDNANISWRSNNTIKSRYDIASTSFVFEVSAVERFAFNVAGGASSHVRINGTKVLGQRLGAITAPAGGATVDAEARTAINAILTAMGATSGHGLTAN